MLVEPTALPEVFRIVPRRHADTRGWFAETWRKDLLAQAGIAADFVQDNQAYSAGTGTLRGLHLQTPPFAQAKLVRVLTGAIYDVALDIRKGSPRYGRWVGVTLSAHDGAQLYVPRGFAHGYCTLEPDTEVAYKVDSYYSKPHEAGIAFDDPDLAIPWPVEPAIVSQQDRDHPRLRAFVSPFEFTAVA